MELGRLKFEVVVKGSLSLCEIFWLILNKFLQFVKIF